LSSSSTNSVSPGTETWLHFVGVGGSGMSALAQYHAMAGGKVTGSDRSFDGGERSLIRQQLEKLGVEIVPQDGTFLSKPEKCGAVVVSTAIEDRIPDIKAAKKAGVPILHRSEMLAQYVASHQTIAITGTSGKSTVTAMVFAILAGCNRGPGLLTGGAVTSLQKLGHIGNAWAPDPELAQNGKPLLVIEADESDGSVVRYHPWAGVVLNLGLDHKEPAEIMTMFETFRSNTQGLFIVADEANLQTLATNAHLFGIRENQVVKTGTFAENVCQTASGSSFTIEDVSFNLNLPGRYNVLNAVASIAVCRKVGLTLAEMAPALQEFTGVFRRFNNVGSAKGIGVIDDFAHNPDKIAAALAAGRDKVEGNGRVLAVFQPHGFGPTRFLRDALIETFVTNLRSQDVLWMPEIFFAGGTVTRDISSADIIEGINAGQKDGRFSALRSDLPKAIAREARPGDLVLVMGARDPSLTSFCGDILESIRQV
jgi:UDP-N-acetylmuramate--L-alanine ligase